MLEQNEKLPENWPSLGATTGKPDHCPDRVLPDSSFAV